MGRPSHRPDPVSRRQVEAMAGYGVPEVDIARVLTIDPKTLRRHYRDELDTGTIKANSKIAESLYRKATGEGPQSVTACIFWLKTRAQWREAPQSHEVAVSNDLNEMNREELGNYIDGTLAKMGYEPLRRSEATANRRRSSTPLIEHRASRGTDEGA